MRPVSSIEKIREPAESAGNATALRGWPVTVARGLLAMTVICRLLTPSDGAAAGETIWVAQLSLLACVVWGVALFRSGSFCLEFDWIDLAVLLLIAGQVVGGLVVVAGSGDQRAALTMLWEWCGLGATFFLARRLLVSPAERREMLLALAAAAVMLSALGLWQHYVGYAESRREYEAIKSEREALTRLGRPADPRTALEWDRSLQRVQAELARMNIPSDEGALMMWEQRLNSTEPFALFALANTLAGLLVFASMIWLSKLVGAARAAPRWQIALGCLAVLVILYCLLLTKSRTAFVGLLAGVAVWVIGARAADSARRWGLPIAVAAIVIAALVGLAAATGGLDRFVVSESAKSLRYRFEYWQASWRMLTDNPRNALLGVGPGNFRQNYLAFKLPASSEEIADPHDLFLDVWAGGGVLSLIGLLGVCVAGLRPLWRGRGLSVPETQEYPSWTDGTLAGAALAHLAVLVPGGAPDETLIVLLLGWLCLVATCRGLFCRDLSRAAGAGALIALAVHLTGAGGIAMPAIAQLLLLAVAFGAASDRPPVWTVESRSRLAGALVALGLLGVYFASWFTGLLPVVKARAELAVGKQELYEERRPGVAERHFLLATEGDPYASEPYELLAQLAFQRWLAAEGAESAEFDRALRWQHEAIVRNPKLSIGYRALGEMHLARFTRLGDLADAASAAEAFGEAVELYPNFALTQAELAEAFWKGGLIEPARAAAARALELDRINEEAGHVDKRLRTNRRELMEEIVK